VVVELVDDVVRDRVDVVRDRREPRGVPLVKPAVPLPSFDLCGVDFEVVQQFLAVDGRTRRRRRCRVRRRGGFPDCSRPRYPDPIYEPSSPIIRSGISGTATR